MTKLQDAPKPKPKKDPSSLKINPEGFITAIVQIPCVDERHAEKKLVRLAGEVHLAFGKTAAVTTPTGKLVPPKNT